jgi:ferrochelatase
VKTAVVLFNLGGPDSLDAVRPFLFNLFNDPAIIGAPNILRWPLAQFISRRRAPTARHIYAQMGGRSPILPQTEAQASALQAALNADAAPGDEWRCFVAMRYWRPFADETAHEVAQWAPDRAILLPLYPQMSTATSESSVADWFRAARAIGLRAPTRSICCWPQQAGWIAAAARLIAKQLERADHHDKVRLLLTAHGLPEKIIERGDPYQLQVEASAGAIVERLAATHGVDRAKLDWRICYQSRVGPLKWIGPSTDAEIERAGAEKTALVLFPIAFVSEHSETLVELDIEYLEKARQCGVPGYYRAPTVQTEPEFVAGLAELVRDAVSEDDVHVCNDGWALRCPADRSRCPRHRGDGAGRIDAASGAQDLQGSPYWMGAAMALGATTIASAAVGEGLTVDVAESGSGDGGSDGGGS